MNYSDNMSTQGGVLKPAVLIGIAVILLCFAQSILTAENSEPKQLVEQTPTVSDQQNHSQEKTKTRKHLDFSNHRNIWSNLTTKDTIVHNTLDKLLHVYKNTVKPLEDAYRFIGLNKDAVLDVEILAKPLILFVGPWSTGKTTFINYLLDIEDKDEKLLTGAEPTTTDFLVLQHGQRYRTMSGMQLVTDQSKAFISLESYGQAFMQRLQGIEMDSPLLDMVTLVDTPGIIENKKQQERGYPFSEVIQWFLQRASLIFLVFDPSKLDVGSELEIVFNQLKGYESKLKLLLNKADTVQQQELMRVYGALFWSLAPLVHSVEPPRIYLGSFWSKTKADHPLAKLFLQEEQTLMQDIRHTVENWVENKIVYVRTHAFRVRLHARTVDSFLQAYQNGKGFFSDNEEIWKDIVRNPEKYGVFRELMKETELRHDIPKAETYIIFFSTHPREMFQPLAQHCSFFGTTCLIDVVTTAIKEDLPELLRDLKEQMSQNYCKKDTCA